MADDPKQLATAPLHLIFQLLFIACLPVLPVLFIGLIIWAGFRWRTVIHDPQYSLRIGIFGLGMVALWIFVNHDPGRVWDWFLD